MEKGDGTEIIYLYNADGQRVFKKVDGQTGEHYIMDGSVNVGVFTENGSLTHWNMLADGVSGRVKPNGDKVYYLKDHLGSTRAVINETGGIQESHDYYPFGLEMPGRRLVSDTTFTKELFTGKERDEETGLDYFGARYYDASIGRWLSVDPLAEKTPHINPYHYTRNNPLNRIDPDGMLDEKERKKALERAKEFVDKNPNKDKNLYEFGKKGEPGKPTDCSGLTSSCVVAAGVVDPIATGSGSGVERTVANTTQVTNNEVQEGNLATFNNPNHIGIVTSLTKNDDGNVISFKMIHSGESTGPVETEVTIGASAGFGSRFGGFYKWDSPDPVVAHNQVKAGPITKLINAINSFLSGSSTIGPRY